MTNDEEIKFHETAQRNAIGGFIGCDGPQCWEQIQEISRDNLGHKIQCVEPRRVETVIIGKRRIIETNG